MEAVNMNPHELAKLDNRQSVLEQKVGHVEREIVNMRDGINSLDTKMSSRLDQLLTKLNESQKPQWSIMLQGGGLLFGLVMALMSLGAYIMSLQITQLNRADQVQDLKIDKVAANTVSTSQFRDLLNMYESNRALNRDERNQRNTFVDSEFKSLKDGQVPRKEHERQWANEAEARTNLQRQIDEIKEQNAQLYNARDVILDLRARVDRVEESRRGPN